MAQNSASVFGTQMENAEEENEKEENQENTNDTELAWEMLEVARVIYARFPGDRKVLEELSKVYLRLGDLGMESGVFEQGRQDYQRSLQLVLQVTPTAYNNIADIHCCMAMSCVYQSANVENETHDQIKNLLHCGLTHYVIAAQSMARVLYQQVENLDDAAILMEKIMLAIPKEKKSNGKQKAGKEGVVFWGQLEALNQVVKENVKDEVVAQRIITTIDIYVELKEKVDGLGTEIDQGVHQKPTTSVGFDVQYAENKENEVSTMPTEKMITALPVRKKRKVAATKADTPSEVEAKDISENKIVNKNFAE